MRKNFFLHHLLTMGTLHLATPDAVFRFIRPRISFIQEEFWVFALNSGLGLIGAKCLFRGTVDECLIHPRDIFRFAMEKNASRLILCHSHPSGQSAPSLEDLEITKDIVKISRLIKIPIEDHVVVSKTDYFSFRKSGLIGKNSDSL